jgi:FkbM family methyltransferase
VTRNNENAKPRERRAADHTLATIRDELRRRLWALGYDVARFRPESHAIARRRRLIRSLHIDVVLDVGANAGQFAHHLRRDLAFEGRICSFEPLSVPFRRLQSRAAEDPDWQAFNFALGDVEGIATINVAANSESSSLLEMLPSHVEAAPQSRFVGTEDVDVRTLDAIFDDLCQPGEGVYLKIDTQGFEGRVLRGADRCLPKIDTVQVEMSLTPLYSDELTLGALYHLLLGKGYVMVGLEPGFTNPQTGQLLQADAIFHRFERPEITT